MIQSVTFTDKVSLKDKTTVWLQMKEDADVPIVTFCHYIYHWCGYKYILIGPLGMKSDREDLILSGTHTIFYTSNDFSIYTTADLETNIIMIYTEHPFDNLKIYTREQFIFVAEIAKQDLTQPFTLCQFGAQDKAATECKIPLLDPLASIVREYMQPYYVKNEHCYSHIADYYQYVGHCFLGKDEKNYTVANIILSKIQEVEKLAS